MKLFQIITTNDQTFKERTVLFKIVPRICQTTLQGSRMNCGLVVRRLYCVRSRAYCGVCLVRRP